MQRLLIEIVALAAMAALAWRFLPGTQTPTVVVYVSHDQVFSEPILKDFEKETGIKVRAVYDTEEAKSTGAMNRLIAEKNNSQADVYWANEPIRAEVLRQRGIAAPYVSPNAAGIPGAYKDPNGYWTGFAARARVLIVNRTAGVHPTSIRAYADPQWRGRAVIANPLFGTTTAQIAALSVLWGDERLHGFMQDLRNNQVKVSPSNGDSADLVARGESAFSLVDSDDVVNRIRQNEIVDMIYPDQGAHDIGCLIVPNAAVLIAGAPHPQAARKLVDYLLSKETERKLAASDAAQLPLHDGVEPPRELGALSSIKTMRVNYAEIAAKLQELQPFLKSWAGP